MGCGPSASSDAAAESQSQGKTSDDGAHRQQSANTHPKRDDGSEVLGDSTLQPVSMLPSAGSSGKPDGQLRSPPNPAAAGAGSPLQQQAFARAARPSGSPPTSRLEAPGHLPAPHLAGFNAATSSSSTATASSAQCLSALTLALLAPSSAGDSSRSLPAGPSASSLPHSLLVFSSGVFLERSDPFSELFLHCRSGFVGVTSWQGQLLPPTAPAATAKTTPPPQPPRPLSRTDSGGTLGLSKQSTSSFGNWTQPQKVVIREVDLSALAASPTSSDMSSDDDQFDAAVQQRLLDELRMVQKLRHDRVVSPSLVFARDASGSILIESTQPMASPGNGESTGFGDSSLRKGSSSQHGRRRTSQVSLQSGAILCAVRDPSPSAFGAAPGSVAGAHEKWSEDAIVSLAFSLASGLRSLHSHNVVHRYLTPECVAVANNAFAILDAGFGAVLEGTTAAALYEAGGRSAGLFPPETLSPPGVRLGSSRDKGDIWALGVLVYLARYGKEPFVGRTQAELFSSIEHREVMHPPSLGAASDLQYEEHLVAFIDAALQKVPAARPTAIQLLRSSFLSQRVPRGDAALAAETNSGQTSPTAAHAPLGWCLTPARVDSFRGSGVSAASPLGGSTSARGRDICLALPAFMMSSTGSARMSDGEPKDPAVLSSVSGMSALFGSGNASHIGHHGSVSSGPAAQPRGVLLVAEEDLSCSRCAATLESSAYRCLDCTSPMFFLCVSCFFGNDHGGHSDAHSFEGIALAPTDSRRASAALGNVVVPRRMPTLGGAGRATPGGGAGNSLMASVTLMGLTSMSSSPRAPSIQEGGGDGGGPRGGNAAGGDASEGGGNSRARTLQRPPSVPSGLTSYGAIPTVEMLGESAGDDSMRRPSLTPSRASGALGTAAVPGNTSGDLCGSAVEAGCCGNPTVMVISANQLSEHERTVFSMTGSLPDGKLSAVKALERTMTAMATNERAVCRPGTASSPTSASTSFSAQEFVFSCSTERQRGTTGTPFTSTLVPTMRGNLTAAQPSGQSFSGSRSPNAAVVVPEQSDSTGPLVLGETGGNAAMVSLSPQPQQGLSQRPERCESSCSGSSRDACGATVVGLLAPPDEFDAEALIEEARGYNSTELLLYDLDLTSVPASLTSPPLVTLHTLDVSANRLTELPHEISFLSSLTRLIVSNNRLKTLPEAIGDLSHLQHLDANNNLLTELPQSLMFIDGMRKLILDYNSFTAIPEVILDMATLTDVMLAANYSITSWPPVDDLKNLGAVTLGLDNHPGLTGGFDAVLRVAPRLTVTWNKIYPDRIIDQIYCGSVRSAQNAHVYEALGIQSVLTVGRGLQPYVAPGMEQRTVLVDDIEGASMETHFEAAVAFTESAVQRKVGVLIHCFAGLSRSATAVVAYLMLKRGMRLDDAYNLVRRGRPAIYPNKGFFSQLLALDAKLFPGQRPLDIVSMERDHAPA